MDGDITMDIKNKNMLVNDIDMSGIAFESIGRTNAFRGVFDGKMHKITNLSIQTTADHTGLFSQVNGGTVKNVGIEDGTVNGGSRTGALIGRCDLAVILNCYARATVTGLVTVGGLLGGAN